MSVFNLTLPLEEAAEGYRAMDQRRAIKTLLRPWTNHWVGWRAGVGLECERPRSGSCEGWGEARVQDSHMRSGASK